MCAVYPNLLRLTAQVICGGCLSRGNNNGLSTSGLRRPTVVGAVLQSTRGGSRDGFSLMAEGESTYLISLARTAERINFGHIQDRKVRSIPYHTNRAMGFLQTSHTLHILPAAQLVTPHSFQDGPRVVRSTQLYEGYR